MPALVPTKSIAEESIDNRAPWQSDVALAGEWKEAERRNQEVPPPPHPAQSHSVTSPQSHRSRTQQSLAYCAPGPRITWPGRRPRARTRHAHAARPAGAALAQPLALGLPLHHRRQPHVVHGRRRPLADVHQEPHCPVGVHDGARVRAARPVLHYHDLGSFPKLPPRVRPSACYRLRELTLLRPTATPTVTSSV